MDDGFLFVLIILFLVEVFTILFCFKRGRWGCYCCRDDGKDGKEEGKEKGFKL